MKYFNKEEVGNASPIFDEKLNRWIAPAYYLSNGEIGGYLFHSKEEAQKELNFIYNQFVSKEQESVRLAEQKILDDLFEIKVIDSYGGFLDKNKMKAGCQRATLEKTIWFPPLNQMISRKDFVETVVLQGFTPEICPKMKKDVAGYLVKDGDKKELVLKRDTSFYRVNKTEWEYAEFLLNK